MTVDNLPARFETPPYPAYPAYPPREEFTLRGVINMLRRRQRLILATAGVITLIVALALALQPRRYEATALVLIDPREQQVLDPEQRLSEVSAGSDLVNSEVETLNSRDMAARLADALNLADDREFNPSAGRRAAGTPLEGRPDRVPDRVAQAVEARRRGETNVIEVTASSRSPEKAALLANGLVEAYLNASVEFNTQAAARAGSWLSERLAELRQEINAREEAVERYRAQAGLLTANGVSLTEQRISEAEASALAARNTLAETQARYRQVQELIARGSSPDTIAATINSEVIRDLRAREADIARREAEYATRYGERHPAMINIRAERQSIRDQIDAELQRIAASLASEVQVARARLASLESHAGGIRSQLTSDNDEEIALRQLEREAAAARAVYESFLERTHEISQQGGLNPTQARLLSRATPPSDDTAPPAPLILLIAAAIGLLAGVIVALVAEQLDDRIESVDDIERETGLRPIASVPMAPKKRLAALPIDKRHPSKYLVDNPHSAFAEALRVIRAAIVYSPSNARQKVVAISSALPGEGKTTIALCLARVAAMSGERVILVDCDVRRRSINDILSIAPGEGLLEVLEGRLPWRDAVGRDDETSAHILPLSTAPVPLSDMVGSRAMRDLVRELSEEYDLVILDSSPVLAVAESRALAGLADVVVMVGRWRKTTAHALATAVAEVRSAGAEVSGVVLNGMNPHAAGRTSYGDPLYYADAKKGYYSA